MTSWGANVNAVDDNGYTPLHYAVENVLEICNVHQILSLLVAGAKRDIKVIYRIIESFK